MVIFRSSGWCNSFRVDDSSVCSLASVDYKNLKKAQSDVTGTPAKVYIVRDRDTGMQTRMKYW